MLKLLGVYKEILATTPHMPITMHHHNERQYEISKNLVIVAITDESATIIDAP